MQGRVALGIELFGGDAVLRDQSLDDLGLSVDCGAVEGEGAPAADEGVEHVEGRCECSVWHGGWSLGDELEGEVRIIGGACFVESVRCVVGYRGEFVR